MDDTAIASPFARIGYLVVLVALALAGHAPAGAASEWGLDDLMRERTGVSESRSRFVETKTSEMLRSPLQTEGTLLYRAPDYLRKTVETPFQQDFLINGEAITITDDQGEQALALSDHPLLAGVIASFRALLAGDLETLRRFYDLAFQGDRAAWSLTLTPIDDRLSGELERVVIDGSDLDIHRIRTLTRSGDVSDMTVLPSE